MAFPGGFHEAILRKSTGESAEIMILMILRLAMIKNVMDHYLSIKWFSGSSAFPVVHVFLAGNNGKQAGHKVFN